MALAGTLEVFYEKDIVTEYEILSEYTENYNYNSEAEKIIIDSFYVFICC